MRQALDLMLGHVAARQPIAVHGDYDVDGVCSTALLVRALRDARCGRCGLRLPSRLEDGYGLSPQTVEELRARGAGLLVTVDCGIGAVEEVALARSLGMDVIVTDHHRPGEELPDCPIVHPVAGRLSVRGPLRDGCRLQARAGAVHGGRARRRPSSTGARHRGARDGRRPRAAARREPDARRAAGCARSPVHGGPGLRALMKVAGVDPQSVNEQTLGFALAPRINAAGRLYRADAGLELLLTDDAERALRDRARARRHQRRAPVGRDRDPVRGRGAARRRCPSAATTRSTCSPARAGIPA